VVDRLGFKRSSVLADLASAAVVAAVPLLHLAGVREFWQLVVLVFVLSSLNALGQVVGPILGGILIAAIGAANVLFVDAASFVASALLVAIGVPAAASRAEPAAAPGGHSYLAELREGLRFIRAHTVLLSMILIATVGNFLDKPLVTVILPVYAKTFYGSPPALPGPRRLRRRRPDRLPAVRLAQAGISEWPPVPAMPMGTPAWPSSPSPGPQSSSTLPCVRARARRSYA
jgi:MFS family permease